MAVAWFRNPLLAEGAELIERDAVNERTFGVSKARSGPAYVFSINKSAGLMHKVDGVTIQWYAIVNITTLGRLKRPAMIAHTICGMNFPLEADRTRTCRIPEPGAILCGRCHGEPASFGKRGAHRGMKRSEAHVKLACIENGYPASLDVVLGPPSDQRIEGEERRP